MGELRQVEPGWLARSMDRVTRLQTLRLGLSAGRLTPAEQQELYALTTRFRDEGKLVGHV